MVVETAFAQIKTIPSHYTKGQQVMPLDEAYQKIVKLGPSAIPFLVDRLTDTTTVDITNACKQTRLRRGDLAFFLINDIEQIPYHTVTKSQWCVFGTCSVLPMGFLEYLEVNRSKFQNQYKAYLNSEDRKAFIKILRG